MNKTTFESKDSQLVVTRTFDANIELVWRAWTVAELLDKWWAPSPWQSKTNQMNFEPNGTRLYAMCGPNGEEHWGLTTYDSINKHTEFSGSDAFCDDKGDINKEMPVAIFKNKFSENANSTTVVVTTQYASEKHLNQVIQMGMKEGLDTAYANLDDLIKSIK